MLLITLYELNKHRGHTIDAVLSIGCHPATVVADTKADKKWADLKWEPVVYEGAARPALGDVVVTEGGRALRITQVVWMPCADKLHRPVYFVEPLK